jgi:GH15 family glucan-1,4-alpha-glucosidase
MPRLIEDFALIGDLHTAALVSRQGSIEWLCVPRFDSDSVFAALLGEKENGCWTLAPTEKVLSTTRNYREGTLVLETTVKCESGSVKIVDFMPRRIENPTIVRVIEGIDGTVEMESLVVCRFAFGSLPPWTRRLGDAITMTIGPDALALRGSVEFEIEPPDARARFSVAAGQKTTLVLQWFPSHLAPPDAVDPFELLNATETAWRDWGQLAVCDGRYHDEILRSLIVLKALMYEPTGGCVAAPTTSLPEDLGGDLNWDYRFAWVRDSAFTIDALVQCGFKEEALAWRDWLLRVLGGEPGRLQIMYSVSGDRYLPEYEAPWLHGFENSRPVRIGNAAHVQFQLGIYGHLMAAIFTAHERAGIGIDTEAWAMLSKLVEHVCKVWTLPDSGIWEYRERPEYYTSSKLMAWVTLDRAVRSVEQGYDGPIERWRQIRDEIHAQVCERGFSPTRKAFVQSYGSQSLDASVLLMPIVGFLPAGDPRVQQTVSTLERELMVDGFMLRDSRHVERDPSGNLRPTEGAFLACNLWLVQNYVLAGRLEAARDLLGRIVAIANDVGLFAEEYDVRLKAMAGNFPQTFSHATFINAAMMLIEAEAKEKG